jgi:hypothetical protein
MMFFGASLHVRQRKPRLALYDVTLPIPGGERDELKCTKVPRTPLLHFAAKISLVLVRYFPPAHFWSLISHLIICYH